MKYKIINTDLFLNGKVIPEGQSIELSPQDVEILSDFIEEDNSESKSKEEKSTKKTKTK